MSTSFYVDRTLGKLAKWLRILGFDTICELDHSKPHESQIDSSRIRLTRKRYPADGHLQGTWITIDSDHLRDQLRQVVKLSHITSDDLRVFSRCLKCNTPIEMIDKTSVRHLVPDYIWETATTFSKCPTCQKIYWPGSHNHRIWETVQTFFQGDAE